MAHLAEVATLYETNARSIIDMLRQMADNLDKPDAVKLKAMAAVTVDEDGDVQIYGWGETDDFHALGLLHVGMAKLAGMRMGDGA